MHSRILPEIPLFEGEDHSLKGRLEHVWIVVGDAFFDNAAFKDLNDDWHVLTSTVVAEEEHKSLHGNPLGIVDSLTRTLKTLLRHEREARIQDGKGKTRIRRLAVVSSERRRPIQLECRTVVSVEKLQKRCFVIVMNWRRLWRTLDTQFHCASAGDSNASSCRYESAARFHENIKIGKGAQSQTISTSLHHRWT